MKNGTHIHIHKKIETFCKCGVLVFNIEFYNMDLKYAFLIFGCFLPTIVIEFSGNKI